MTTMWRGLGMVVVLAAAGCTGAAAPAQDVAADKAKLVADADRWFGFYANADGPAMANLYSEDALLMPPGAPAASGRAAIQAYLAEDSAKAKSGGFSLRPETTGADVSGDMGWVSGRYRVVDGTGMAVDSGSYLSVHKRTNGQWLYIRDTWNSDRPPAAAK